MARHVLLEDTYQGPMDLLLYLVKRDEIDIHDIPISHLTQAYLTEIAALEVLDVDQSSEFMSLAAMLIEIKGRMLLPPSEDEESDDEDVFDPRAGLVEALLEYKRFKEAAASLGQQADDFSQRFARYAPRIESFAAVPDAPELNNPLELLTAFQKLSRYARPVVIQDKEIPTRVRIEQIKQAILMTGRTVFSKLLSDDPGRDELVGFFIALLELIRLRQANARQSEDFSDIHIEQCVRTAPEVASGGGDATEHPTASSLAGFLALEKTATDASPSAAPKTSKSELFAPFGTRQPTAESAKPPTSKFSTFL